MKVTLVSELEAGTGLDLHIDTHHYPPPCLSCGRTSKNGCCLCGQRMSPAISVHKGCCSLASKAISHCSQLAHKGIQDGENRILALDT